MRRTIPLILSLAGTLTLSACGDNPSGNTASDPTAPSSEPSTGAMEAPAQPEVPLVGEFEMNGPEPFIMSAGETVIQCQSASPGSPFRAQWSDTATGMNVLVTGWPSQDGSAQHRVDLFQVVLFTPQAQTKARLSGATLSVEEVSRTGFAAIYSVHASGTFEEGGTFTASGHCRA